MLHRGPVSLLLVMTAAAKLRKAACAAVHAQLCASPVQPVPAAHILWICVKGSWALAPQESPRGRKGMPQAGAPVPLRIHGMQSLRLPLQPVGRGGNATGQAHRGARPGR
jgi:hypothetical protein